MKARLVRALQRGGMAVQIGADRWGVWRGRDRRGRMIGVISGAEIDVLRMREALQPWGEGQPPILVWNKSVLAPPPDAPSAKRLTAAEPAPTAPLIELVLSRCHDRELRQLICETTQTYRADIECAAQVGAAHGMNWDGLALGGRVDGGRGDREFRPAPQAMRAQAALKTIHAQLSGDQIELLDRLILSADSRAQLVRRLGGRPSLMEPRALAAIRALHEVYKAKIGARY